MKGSNIVMTRTFHAKVPHYQSDGSGRDHFITNTNGGLAQGRIENFTQSTFFFKRNPHDNGGSQSPRKDAVAIEYRSDGTGRDSYIVANSGGLKNDYMGHIGERSFKDSLRQQEHVPFRRIKHRWESDITDYLNWPSPRGKSQIA